MLPTVETTVVVVMDIVDTLLSVMGITCGLLGLGFKFLFYPLTIIVSHFLRISRNLYSFNNNIIVSYFVIIEW